MTEQKELDGELQTVHHNQDHNQDHNQVKSRHLHTPFRSETDSTYTTFDYTLALALDGHHVQVVRRLRAGKCCRILVPPKSFSTIIVQFRHTHTRDSPPFCTGLSKLPFSHPQFLGINSIQFNLVGM